MSRAIECQSGYNRSDSPSLARAFQYVRGMVPHLWSALYAKGQVRNSFQLLFPEHCEQVCKLVLFKHFNEDGIHVLLSRLLQRVIDFVRLRLRE